MRFVPLFGLGVLCIITCTRGQWHNQYSEEANTAGNPYHDDNHRRGLHGEVEEGPFDLSEYLATSCPRGIPIDRAAVKTAEKCLLQYMGDEKVEQLLSLFSPRLRDFQEFGSRLCNLWPNILRCWRYLISYAEKCSGGGGTSRLGQIIGTMVDYLCSVPVGGPTGANYLGDLLFYSDGLQCVNLLKYADCSGIYTWNEDANVCRELEKSKICWGTAFDGCKSSKPRNIIASALDTVADQFGCDDGAPKSNKSFVSQ